MGLIGEHSPAERRSLSEQNHVATKTQVVGMLVQCFFKTPTRESDGDGYSKCTWQMMQTSFLSKAMQTQDALSASRRATLLQTVHMH